MGPQQSNVYKWMVGGALVGLLSGLTQLKSTWGAEDIGSIFGDLDVRP